MRQEVEERIRRTAGQSGVCCCHRRATSCPTTRTSLSCETSPCTRTSCISHKNKSSSVKSMVIRLLVSLMCAMVCMSPIILVTGKPYSSKRLSYGESMDWNFGGWTPVGGGGGGSLGSERQLKSHHSLFDSSSFRGSEFASILTPVPSSPSSFQSFPSSASLKHSPSSSSSHSSSSHSLALQHLTPMMTTSRLQQQQRHHLLHQEEDSSESMIMGGKQQQASSSSPTASPSMTRAYRFLDSISNNNIPASPAAALRNQVPKPYLGPGNQAAPAGHATVHYPSSPLDKESAATLLSDVHPGIKMEAKPLREAQIEAYKVIEQLEAQQEHLNSVSQSGKASLLPSDGQTGGEAQSYSAMHPMPMPGYQVSGGYGKPSLQSMDSYSLMPSRKQTTGKNPFNPYTLLNNLVGSKNYSPQQQQNQQNSESKTIGLPVKEITNDYVTLPVAVETDADKVLTQADIREIEQEVLKAIPETLGSYGDKLPDNLYEQALQIDPSHGTNGPKYETIELPPSVLMHGQQQGRQLYGGNNQQQHKQSNPFLNGFMHNVRMPGFISALSPSKAKISDILKPLLRKVRPPLPASPAQQLKEGPTDVPNIPGNAPYAGSHRPENLDVVHFIAHQSGNPQSGGSSGGGGEPVVYHVNQLMRTPPRSFPRGNKNKKRRKNNNNNVNFPPPQAYQQMHYASQYGNGNDMTSNNNNGNTRNQYSSLMPSRTPIPFGPQEQALLHAMTQPLGPQPQNPPSNDQVTYEIVQEPPSAATRPPPLDPYMTGYTARPPLFPPSYGQTFDLPQPQQQQQYQQQPQAPPQQQQTIMVPPPQSYTRPSSLPPAPVQYQQQEEQQQQQLQQQSYGPQNQQPNHQQSQPNSNNNPYIEVVNLPSGGGGQSVHYNPPPAQYLPPSQEQQQQPEYQIQTNGQQYDQQQQQQQNNYASAQSYENEMKGGSGQQLNGQGVSMEYIDPQPVFSPATLDSYSGHQQQQQSQSGRKEKEVVTLNNYKQTVSSLDPKTLVELIAKQVPSLKDVLTGGGQESGSGYGQQQQQQQQESGPKDTSYEIIEMPPKYHSDANEYSPNAGGPPAPSDGGYSMGQSDGSNGGSGGGVQQESYFIRHTSEQQDGNNNNNYGNSNPHDAEYAAASSESAEAHPGSHAAHESGKAESGSGPQEDQESHPTALSSLRHQESGSPSPSDPLSPSPASNEDDAGEDQDNKYNNEMSDTSATASGPLDRVPDDSRQGAQQQQEPLLIRNTDRYDGLDSLSSSSPSSSSSSSGVKRLKDKKRTPYFGSSSYGQRIRGSESSHSPSYSVSSSSQSSSSSSSSSSEGKEPESGSAGEKGVKIKATVEVSKIPVSDFTSILLDQHVTQKSKLAKKSTHNNNNSRQHHHQDDEDTGSDQSRHQDHEQQTPSSSASSSSAPKSTHGRRSGSSRDQR